MDAMGVVDAFYHKDSTSLPVVKAGTEGVSVEVFKSRDWEEGTRVAKATGSGILFALGATSGLVLEVPSSGIGWRERVVVMTELNVRKRGVVREVVELAVLAGVAAGVGFWSILNLVGFLRDGVVGFAHPYVLLVVGLASIGLILTCVGSILGLVRD
jgi:hypothetical protein